MAPSPKTSVPLVGAVSGFLEYLPAQQRGFDAAVDRVRKVYEGFGFTPLETAAVERIETLTSKGIDAKEVYGLRRLAAEDGGDKDLALRFDLTVPLARYVVQNQGALTFPFRRYQAQPVWRGERAQAGRYRQFYQFDIDTIGDGSLPLAADAEVLAAAATALDALGVGDFTMRLNNRKLLEGLLRWARAKDIPAAIKAVDDAEKVGWDVTEDLLVDKAGIAADVAPRLCRFLRKGEADALDVPVHELDEAGRAGMKELVEVLGLTHAMLPERLRALVKADFAIARGLDYYTGTVVETRLHAAPELGSICSGGRYENLTESLGKKKMPGVGISIGISRLCAWLLGQPGYADLAATPAKALVGVKDGATLGDAAHVARELRERGVAVEMALEADNLGRQFMRAEARGIRHGVTVTPDKVLLKTFADRKEEATGVAEIAKRLG
jgi:histidyl-tRNA synthetase